ncbi:MAG: hypothetical protein IPK10_01225 [Bacteroidetes bacterium]|nr:hypothetical protein [Bacteroidota bacterium]
MSGLYSVKHSLDGGYFICGNAGGGFVDPMYVAKLDSMGFVIWYKTFYNSGMFIFYRYRTNSRWRCGCIV